MSYPLDPAAQNAGLQAWFGDGRAASVPSSWEVALFDGHPLTGGTELTSDGGYARAVVANTSANFPDPVDGVVTSVPIPFGTSTGAWSTSATHYVLIDAADGTTRWFPGVLAAEVSVDAASTTVEAQLIIYWNQES